MEELKDNVTFLRVDASINPDTGSVSASIKSVDYFKYDEEKMGKLVTDFLEKAVKLADEWAVLEKTGRYDNVEEDIDDECVGDCNICEYADNCDDYGSYDPDDDYDDPEDSKFFC